jgi:hypothetical protein
MINVEQKEDGTFDISWDPEDPSESMFNTWSETDFINAIDNYLKSFEKNATDGESTNL